MVGAMTRPERLMAAGDAVAVRRFRPQGVTGYIARTMPNSPVRATRAEAIDDERQWLDRPDTG